MRKVGQMLKSAVGRDEVIRAAQAQRILRDWTEIVGPEMATRSYPDRYDRGTVWIAVEGSSWAQELRMQSERILEKLGDKAGDASLFRQLRFGVRRLPEMQAEEPPEPDKDAPQRPTHLSIREIAEERLRNWPGGRRPS